GPQQRELRLPERQEEDVSALRPLRRGGASDTLPYRHDGPRGLRDQVQQPRAARRGRAGVSRSEDDNGPLWLALDGYGDRDRDEESQSLSRHLRLEAQVPPLISPVVPERSASDSDSLRHRLPHDKASRLDARLQRDTEAEAQTRGGRESNEEERGETLGKLAS